LRLTVASLLSRRLPVASRLLCRRLPVLLLLLRVRIRLAIRLLLRWLTVLLLRRGLPGLALLLGHAVLLPHLVVLVALQELRTALPVLLLLLCRGVRRRLLAGLRRVRRATISGRLVHGGQ
jgi:hypothetical protein